eukprot:TRINITY_DN1283_c0_g1_i4.p1 TRINITY_DN1283_c0_g1~~TRINITY_DN1283_c0_g1_i4.p1  ORF type:complete len:311 (+),score=83.25 TRINITY_DN1283_c0_g1_i4:302-1234(+)
MKIVLHCRQNISTLVTGQLLGLEIDGKLHVTDSFPLPIKGDEEGAEDVSQKYSLEMLKLLSAVNVDNNLIGWYQSTYLTVHVNQFLIETQFTYQSDTPESVVVTYDPLLASHGNLGLKAFRLTDAAMKLRKENTFSKEKLLELDFTSDDILKEVPIVISSGVLGQTYLSSVMSQDPLLQDQFEYFDLSCNDYLQKNLEVLSYCFSDLQREQGNHANWQRSLARSEGQQHEYIQKRKATNQERKAAGQPLLSEDMRDLEIENPSLFKKPVEPSQLESLLIAHRIDTHCERITQFGAQALTKLYVVKALDEL